MAVPSSVFIREVGPREGLQTTSKVVSTEQKLELIDLLGNTGVQEIEITSMVRPDRVPQMADADELIQRLVPRPGVRYTALYLNRRGFERAEASRRLDNQAWLYTATSDTFLSKNSNTRQADFLAQIPGWLESFAAAAKSLHGVMFSTAFGCAYEGKAAAHKLDAHLDEVMVRLGDLGAEPKEISFADTVGLGTPESVKRAVAAAKAKYPKVRLSLHLHDTRGTGIANAYAGLREGVDCFDASVGGVGGCPFTPGAAGNIATEDLAYLCEELGVKTGLDLRAYGAAAKFMASVLGGALPGRYYRTVS